jgi:hypothetical protein
MPLCERIGTGRRRHQEHRLSCLLTGNPPGELTVRVNNLFSNQRVSLNKPNSLTSITNDSCTVRLARLCCLHGWGPVMRRVAPGTPPALG